MRQGSDLRDNTTPTINLYLSSFWTTGLAQITIDEGVGRTKKAHTAFNYKFDAHRNRQGIIVLIHHLLL
jgi:hypothetical protein